MIIWFSGHLQAQLASEPDASEKLVDAFAVLDRLSESYCCRGTGTYLTVRGDVAKTLNLYVISATCKEYEFHTWGQCVVKGAGGIAPIVTWHDALRDRQAVARNRFQIGFGDGTRVRSTDQELETAEQLEKNPEMVWTWPELNPFGLAFGTESRLQNKESSLSRVKEITLRYTLVKSSTLKNRNTRGEWKSPDGTAYVSIEFDRGHGDLPCEFKWEKDHGNNQRELLGLTKTTWVKYPFEDQISFVPSTTVIATDRLSGVTADIELAWDWIPHKKWEQAKPELKNLFSADLQVFRQPFVDLFEAMDREAGSKGASKARK